MRRRTATRCSCRRSPIITNQIINPNKALDLTSDFEHIALIQNAPIILVVNPKSNIHSVKDLIALCKAKPNEALNTNVIGSMPHFASELFAQQAGIKLTQVPYQGSPQAVADVVAGRTLMTFSPVSTVVGLIAAGKLVALATTTSKRASALPDVPHHGGIWTARRPDEPLVRHFGAHRHATPHRRQARRRLPSGGADASRNGRFAQAGRRSTRCRPTNSQAS